MQTSVFYRVEPPASFSSIYAETLEEARAKKHEFGECPKGTPANKAFWAKQRDLCKIVRVIEITEEITD